MELVIVKKSTILSEKTNHQSEPIQLRKQMMHNKSKTNTLPNTKCTTLSGCY